MIDKAKYYIKQLGLVSGPLTIEMLQNRLFGNEENTEISTDGILFTPYIGSEVENLLNGDSAPSIFDDLNFGASAFELPLPNPSGFELPLPNPLDKIDTPFGIQKKNTPNNINHSRQSSKTAMLSGSFLDLSEEKQTREKFALPSEQKPEVVEKTAHERALSLQVSERKATQILDHKGIFQHGDSSKKADPNPIEEIQALPTPKRLEPSPESIEALPIPKKAVASPHITIPTAKGMNENTFSTPFKGDDFFNLNSDSHTPHFDSPDDPLSLFSDALRENPAAPASTPLPSHEDFLFSNLKADHEIINDRFKQDIVTKDSSAGEVIGLETMFRSKELSPKIPPTHQVSAPVEEIKDEIKLEDSEQEPTTTNSESLEPTSDSIKVAQVVDDRQKKEKSKRLQRSKRNAKIQKIIVVSILLILLAVLAYLFLIPQKAVITETPPTPSPIAAVPTLEEKWLALASDEYSQYKQALVETPKFIAQTGSETERRDWEAYYLATLSLSAIRYPDDFPDSKQKAENLAKTLSAKCQSDWCTLGLGLCAILISDNEIKAPADWLDNAKKNAKWSEFVSLIGTYPEFLSLLQRRELGFWGSQEKSSVENQIASLSKLAPQYRIAELWQATLLGSLGKWEEILAVLETSTKAESPHFGALILKIEALLQLARFDEASTILGNLDLSSDKIAISEKKQLHILSSQILMNQAQWQKAREQLQEALALFPNDAQIIKNLSATFILADQYSEGIDYFSKLLESEKQKMPLREAIMTNILYLLNIPGVLSKGVMLNDSILKLLETHINQGISDNPEYASLWFFQGIHELLMNKSPEAEAAFLKADKLMHSHWLVRLALSYLDITSEVVSRKTQGLKSLQVLTQDWAEVDQVLGTSDILRALGMTKEAVELARNARLVYPNDMRLIENDLKNSLATNSLDDAEKAYNELLTRKYTLARHQFYYATALESAGEIKRALELMTEVLLEDKSNTQYLGFVGVLYYKMEKYDAAKQYFETVLESNISDLRAHFYLGRCQFETENYELALLSFQRVFDLDNNNLESQLWMGLSFERLERKNDATRSYSAVIDRYLLESKENLSDFDQKTLEIIASSYLRRAKLTKERRRRTEAREDFKNALKINPQSLESASEYVIFLYETGDIDTAFEEILKIERVQTDTMDSTLFYIKGVILLKKHQRLEALSALEKARELGFGARTSSPIIGLRDPSELFMIIAYLYRDLGKSKEARESMENYLRDSKHLSDSTRKSLRQELERM